MKFSGLVSALLASGALAHDAFSVAFVSSDSQELYGIINKHHDLDFGCRPAVISKDGEHRLHAFLSADKVEELKRSLNPATVRIDTYHNLQARQSSSGAPIGTGDRFANGTIPPRGSGSQTTSAQVNAGILNVAEVDSALRGLAAAYGVQTFTAPFKTYEGRSVYGLVANSKAASAQTIYFTSGIHARERGGPDNLIYFVSDLLYANKAGTGLTYGAKKYTNAQVKTALDQGIVIIPLLNPDGVTYDQSSGSRWRKNRNPKSAGGVASRIGVDLNRNFDILWDYPKYFSSSVAPASTNPSSETYKGTAAFSEPETQNVRWGYQQFPNLAYYIDVHSAAGTMLYAWGLDDDQTTTPTQNFKNAAFDGKRGVVGDNVYREYIAAADLANIQELSNRTTTAMQAVGGRDYISQQSVGLYPTSGASDDWSFSRSQAGNTGGKTYGFTMEFGYPTNFYPTTTEFRQNIIDTNAGFMDFILTAAEQKA